MSNNISPNLINLDHPSLYFNRELSWLDFNKRVIYESAHPDNPLLEQLKFLAIGSSNLDEFFMVRVAGLLDQIQFNMEKTDNKTHLSPRQQLKKIRINNLENLKIQSDLLNRKLRDLQKQNIYLKTPQELSFPLLKEIAKRYHRDIAPLLNPVKLNHTNTLNSLSNKQLHLLITTIKNNTNVRHMLTIPQNLPRYYLLKEGEKIAIVLVESILLFFISHWLPELEIQHAALFRITRNADLEIHEEETEDLLSIIEDYLVRRKTGKPIRLEWQTLTKGNDQAQIIENELHYFLSVSPIHRREVYTFDSMPIDLSFLFDLVKDLEKYVSDKSFTPFVPNIPRELRNRSVYTVIEQRDVFLHHPYDSFKPVLDFLSEAASSSDTVEIRQTLYRVSDNSPIVHALMKAAEKGINVIVLVELKARFDEKNNMAWAKELEDAGCTVLYGIIGLKTHSKATLVTKRKNGTFKHYVHLGTGNYNEHTATLYTDMGILTTHPDIVKDVITFFDSITEKTVAPEYSVLHVSPFDIQSTFISEIKKEIAWHQKTGKGHIIAKMNSLTDKKLIKQLYLASMAGVKIELIIRGICCLKPELKKISEHISVKSIVGRYLEHSRIYYFSHNETLYLSSADMMTRNMVKRVELAFPILDKDIKKEIKDILSILIQDDTNAWNLTATGKYIQQLNTQSSVDSHQTFMKKTKK